MCSKDKEVDTNQSWGASKDNAQYEAELTATMVTLICITTSSKMFCLSAFPATSDLLGEHLRDGVGGDRSILCTVHVANPRKE